MQAFYFYEQRLCIFSQKLSNENRQELYKIQKPLTSLFYHVLLIKQNECTLGLVYIDSDLKRTLIKRYKLCNGGK